MKNLIIMKSKNEEYGSQSRIFKPFYHLDTPMRERKGKYNSRTFNFVSNQGKMRLSHENKSKSRGKIRVLKGRFL